MFKLISIIIFFIPNFIYAIELKCDFEEVYKTGEIQQGFFLIKDQNLRYEYLEKSLFKIFYVDGDIIVVENKDGTKKKQINQKNTAIDYLMEIAHDFPNIQDRYEFNDVKINIEKNISNDFIKRISFKSNKINMSLYPLNCNFKPINGLFFKFDPVFEYIK